MQAGAPSELPKELSSFLSATSDELDCYDSLEHMVADWIVSVSHRDELLNQLDELVRRPSLPVEELVDVANRHLTSQEQAREFLVALRAALAQTSPDEP